MTQRCVLRYGTGSGLRAYNRSAQKFTTLSLTDTTTGLGIELFTGGPTAVAQSNAILSTSATATHTEEGACDPNALTD